MKEMNNFTGLCKSFSLYYNDLARWLFIALTFTGLMGAGWFGIPLTPIYFTTNQVDPVSAVLTLISVLGTIWGAMGYRELTRSAERILSAKYKAKELDPLIGDYQYRSYNPETKQYETGYLPLGPIDFWDKETKAPSWLDKGKYWHILLGLQSKNREIVIQVVRDSELPFYTGHRNVAVTTKERVAFFPSQDVKHRYFRYRVKIPQWLVMNTERARYVNPRELQTPEGQKIRSRITELNKTLVIASQEVIEREKPRIIYPHRISALGVYLNKSLPLRIIYEDIVRQLPSSKRTSINDINKNLANAKDDELMTAIIHLASDRGIPQNSLRKIKILMNFLKNAYDIQGLGEGSTEYHNYHHSLEVAYMILQLLPHDLRGFDFTGKDYELILVSALLHDYDPVQSEFVPAGEETVSVSNNNNWPMPIKGPKVRRTIDELKRIRVHEAFYMLTPSEFEEYFRDRTKSPSAEFSTTHPEYLQTTQGQDQSKESLAIESIIWHTDFPYPKQVEAQKVFSSILKELSSKNYDEEKLKLLAEILWLADLSVTYVSSDPIRAWDRVTSLYDELYLPKLEAVSRTDAFFSDFAESRLFKELLNAKTFPDVFKQRWNLVYQFFHEGNPSTQLNRTIVDARRLFLKVNIQIAMTDGEMLERIAIDNWAEYFIGIGDDQHEVLKAKNRFAMLEPPNASAFWGSAPKLIPNVIDGVIDNFILIVPRETFKQTVKSVRMVSFISLLLIIKPKLRHEGSIHVLTDVEAHSEAQSMMLHVFEEAGFYPVSNQDAKFYFPKDWRDPRLKGEEKVLLFRAKGSS